jgi:hypothetical protein
MANPMTSTGTDSPFLPRRMSFEEWAALPEDEPGELVDGFLVEEEVPDYVHEIAIAWLIQTLRNWGSSRGALVAGSGAKFRVTPHRGRMPDLTVYLPGDSKPPKRGLITTPPSIAVEVVSGTVLRKPHLMSIVLDTDRIVDYSRHYSPRRIRSTVGRHPFHRRNVELLGPPGSGIRSSRRRSARRIARLARPGRRRRAALRQIDPDAPDDRALQAESGTAHS